MTIQTSGAISFADIATEFGIVGPVSMQSLYKGGPIISNDDITPGGVPASGIISLWNFYGAQKYKPPGTNGQNMFTIPGNYTWVFPSEYESGLNVEIIAIGGGRFWITCWI